MSQKGKFSRQNSEQIQLALDIPIIKIMHVQYVLTIKQDESEAMRNVF